MSLKDQPDSVLEQRMSIKVAQLLDKRVNTELDRIRRDVEDKHDSFKDVLKNKMKSQLKELNTKVDLLAGNTPSTTEPDIFSLGSSFEGIFWLKLSHIYGGVTFYPLPPENASRFVDATLCFEN